MLANGTLLQTRYLIKRPLAQSDAAIVYEAEAAHLNHAVVEIKETRMPKTHQHFQQQADLSAISPHPALPKILDFFVEGDSRFVVTELIPGQSLAELLSEKLKTDAKPFDWRQAADWADRILDALEFLHRRQPPIFHGRISPDALKLTAGGELFLTGLEPSAAESTELRADALPYAPPEQLDGATPDARGDLYSLGATLHFLLSGQTPDDVKMRRYVMRYKVPDPLPMLHELNPQIPQPPAEVIYRALSLAPSARFQSAQAMREALQQALAAPPATPETEDAKRRRQWEDRKLQIETERRRRQEIAAGPQDEAEQRRREEEKRLLAEQRRQEEERRHREARQRDLEQQRKQAEERRRLQQQERREAAQRQFEEERLSDQKRLEQAEKQRQESARRESARKGSEKKAPLVEAPVDDIPSEKSAGQASLTPMAKNQNAARLPRARLAAAAAGILIVLSVLWLWPQNGTETAPRPLPLTPSPAKPTPSPTPALPEQLQYWFEQFANGQAQSLARHELAAEQEFKLHFKSREDGYLYLLAPDGVSGQLTAFLPGGARLNAGREFVFPNRQRIRGLAAGEQLRFTVVFSRARLSNFDALLRQVKAQPEAIKSLQTQLGAISPGGISPGTEDFSGRGAQANVVSNMESQQPLLFDINLKFTGN